MARTTDVILQGMLNSTGKGGRMRQKLTATRERNWLLALTLNSFAKLDEGAQLTDLNRAIIDTFRENGFDEDDLKAQGRVYRQLPTHLRQEIFPDQYAMLTVNSQVSFGELAHDLPRLDRQVAKMPNAMDVDVHAIHAGRATESDFRLPPRDVVRRHSGGLTRTVSLRPNWPPEGPLPQDPDIPPDTPVPPEQGGNGADKTPPAPEASYRIKATGFKCLDESGWDWTGSDEPYWIFGSVVGKETVTTRTGTFGDVDSGSSRSFSSTDGWIWGQNGQAQPLAEGELGALVQLWEHDGGDPAEVQQGVKAAFAVAIAVLTATGVGASITAVVGAVGALVHWLVGFMDDDHIADQTFVFDRKVIEGQLGAAGSSFTIQRLFTDGDADYRLTIEVARMA